MFIKEQNHIRFEFCKERNPESCLWLRIYGCPLQCKGQFCNTVASLGTAFTQAQLKALRETFTVRVVFSSIQTVPARVLLSEPFG